MIAFGGRRREGLWAGSRPGRGRRAKGGLVVVDGDGRSRAVDGAVPSSSSPCADDVADPELPPGSQDSGDLGEHGVLVVESTMTQLEITTSTDSSSRGMCSIVPWRNSTFEDASCGGVAAGELDHLQGGVEPVDVAGRIRPVGPTAARRGRRRSRGRARCHPRETPRQRVGLPQPRLTRTAAAGIPSRSS